MYILLLETFAEAWLFKHACRQACCSLAEFEALGCVARTDDD